MLGLGLRLSQSAAWMPCDITAVQFWAAGFSPAAGRMFQDAEGAVAAYGALQPIGLLNSAVGGKSASQPTALSKPTLSRFPKAGLRNLAMGAQAVGNNSYWRDSSINSGVSCTKIGHGVEADGVPYADLRFQGVPTAVSSTGGYHHSYALSDAEVGAAFTSRYRVKLLSATSLEAVNGFRASVSSVNAAGTYLGETASDIVFPTESYAECLVSTVVSLPTTVKVRNALILHCKLGQSAYPIDFTARISGMQLEAGLQPSPLQYNYGPNEVYEIGVPDLWHLHNDGGDSLALTLPAGVYGVASLSAAKEPLFELLTLEGAGAINLLRRERQLDVVIKAGSFTTLETSALRNYWQGVMA